MSSKRINIAEEIKVQIVGSPGDILAIMKNISKSGSHFEVFEGDYVPQSGDIIEIKSYHHDYFAEVVWSRDESVGVCFFDLKDIENRLMNKTSFGRA